MARALRGVPTVVVGMLIVAVLFTAYTAQQAFATHQPADKVHASADDLKSTSATETPIAVLEEQMRVSSPVDLIIQVTSECSILTSLLTGAAEDDTEDSAFAFGQVKMFVSIDGKRVPVSTNDTFVAQDGGDTSDTSDFGEVVFCNRAYQRTVEDSENDDDGIDTQDDFIRTRTANGFNWFAIDTGEAYDDPANGNNILDIVLWAEFTKEPHVCATPGEDDDQTAIGDTCAEALIGSRTMIIEPTHASNHEQPQPIDSTTPTSPPPNTATPSPKKGNGN